MMKFINIAITLATAGSIVVAQPHRHHHRHADKRAPDYTQVVNVPGPTVLAFELNGKLIPQSDVCNGIADGSLQWADGTSNPPACDSHPVASPAAEPMSTASPSPTPAGHEYFQQAEAPASSSTSTTSTIPVYEAPSSSASPATASDYSSSSSSSTSSGTSGLDQEFPSGEISCSEFPLSYGAIDVHWAGHGGWSGIQVVDVAGNDPTTDDVTLLSTGDSCEKGSMCSYACPPGYQKSQWPKSQGKLGQSIGGIYCGMDNKLHLTNPSLSKTLCIPGTGLVSVQNKLNKNAAICRTDYPGTESETVPLNTMPGSTNDLTCPDSATYYVHRDGATTAQYYVNNQGVIEEEACTWGTDGSNKGNWAPTYFGVGTDTSGKTWLSIASTIQNNPQNYQDLNYNVAIVGEGLANNCTYSNGQYCGGGTCTSIADYYKDGKVPGCTVELQSGTATYVLS